MVSLEQYDQLVADRPIKYSPEEVGYQAAPEGSAIRCAGCFHFYQRATDHFGVCEIMRSEETDTEGVRPDWRCQFQTVDGEVHPLLEEDQ